MKPGGRWGIKGLFSFGFSLKRAFLKSNYLPQRRREHRGKESKLIKKLCALRASVASFFIF